MRPRSGSSARCATCVPDERKIGVRSFRIAEPIRRARLALPIGLTLLALAPAGARQPGPTVRGTLLGVDGGAATGIEVQLLDCTRRAAQRDHAVGPPTTSAGPSNAGCTAALTATARTGVKGDFALRSPAAGVFIVRALPDGPPALERRVGPTVDDVTLPPLRLVPLAPGAGDARAPVSQEPERDRLSPRVPHTGLVVSAETHRPIPGALVWVDRDGAVGESALTDENGRYRLLLDPAKDGDAALRAAARGFAARSRPLGALPETGETELPALALEPAWTLEGVVADPADRPVAGVELVLATGRRGEEPVHTSNWSDENGAFRLHGLVYDRAAGLRVSKRGFATLHRQVAPPPRGRSSLSAALRIEPGVEVAGRLVDDEGLLLAGATVLLGRGREEQADPALGAAWGLRLLRPQRALTDDAGRFRFEGVRPGPASLLVHAPGYFDALLGDVDARPPPEPARGSTDALRADLGDLVVPRGPTIRGRVVDPEGRWLEGVRIWFGASEQLKARGYAMPDSPVWVTGPDGGFELAGLPDRGVEVRVELEGWMPVERERRLGPPHGSPLVLAMTPERSVRGLVAWRSGATIAGARVRAHVRPTRGAGFTGEPVRTDAEGGFELRGLVDGVVELWAVAEGARPGSVEVALDGGDPGGDVVVELDPGATLRGVVLGPGGRPVTDAVVGAGRIEASTRFPNGVRPDFAPWDGTTDGEGRFELKHLEPGPTRVRVQHDEHLPLSTELELEAGEREIELVLERGYEIRGTVVDEQGEPLPRARIYRMQHRADGSSGGGSTSTVTDAAGGFVLTGLEPAVYELSARRDDLGVGKARPVVIEDRSVSGVEIVVPAGVSVEGRIDGLSPQELRDAWIRASGPAILGSKSAWAFDDAGSFRLRGLTPGWWEISGYSETAGRTSTVVEVGDAPITGVVLRFARDDGTTLSGLVLRQGEPVLGAYVTLSPDSGGFRPSTRTDAGGSFRFESLPPGEVTVTATAEGGHASLTLDPEGDETIVLELEQGELELLVVDAENGGPVEGARATLVEPAGGRTSRSYGEWTSDAFGRISIDHRPGVYTLTVGHAELLRTEIEGVEIRPWERAGPLEVALERGTTLRLRVVGPDGEPLPARAAQARANHPSERTHAHGASDAEGRIELHPLPPGRIAVAVTAPGLAPSRLEVTVPQNNIVPVRLGRGGNVRVLVPELQASGELALLLASRGGVDQATRSLGSFSVIDGEGLAVALPPGEVKLLVRSPDGRGPRYQATAMVVEGEEVTVVAREAPPEPRP